MAHPEPHHAEPCPGPDSRIHMQRSPEQAADETAKRQIAETLSNIEQAIRRAEKGERIVRETVDEPNLVVALATAREQLEAAHKKLFQLGYFGGDQQRLL